MWKLGLSAIGLGLLAAGVGGHSADAAERRCEFRFDHEKPAWIAELNPRGLQNLAALIGQIDVLQRMDADPPQNYEERCGCFMDHVDWDAIRERHPESYWSGLMTSGGLPAEFRRHSDELLELKTRYRRKHCL